MREKGQQAERTRKSLVITKAFLRAVEFLEMSRSDVALLLGISEASLTRLFQGGRAIESPAKEGEIATYFLRLYRSLDTLFGGNRENSVKWFKSSNTHLGGVPIELVKSIGGLVEVTGYLDAMRGKV
jgi:transcriptional regulator with XRE-family HTH domain